MPGVLLEGLPGNPTSDADGGYSAAVEPNWTGQVTPRLDGYQFRPTSRRYTQIVSSTENQDYVPVRLAFPIAGSVGVEGVVMKGLPGPAITEADGCYKVLVEHGWTGSVEPAKQGYTFEPPVRHYDSVTREWIHENYTANPAGTLDTEGGSSTPVTHDVHEPAARSGRARPWPAHPGPLPEEGVHSPSILILPAARGRMGNLAEIEEDLLVMSTIIQETLEGTDQNGGVPDPGPETGSDLPGPNIQAVYIQDFGVIFSAWMRHFPAIADPSGSGEDLDGPRDPVWEEARQQVLTATGQGPMMTGPPRMAIRQDLEARLVGSLKHAARIRHLGPEQWVAVHLTWDRPGPAPASSGAPRLGRECGATLRVKKGTVDLYLAGALEERAFRQAVQVLVQ